METTNLLNTACAYWNAGLCPLPRVIGHVEPSYIDNQGESQPISWSAYKRQRPDWPTVANWFLEATSQLLASSC